MQIYRINRRKYLLDLETFGFFLIRCLPFIVFSLSSWLLSLLKEVWNIFFLIKPLTFSLSERITFATS